MVSPGFVSLRSNYCDPSSAQYSLLDAVAGLQHLLNSGNRSLFIAFMHEGLMHLRVEFFARSSVALPTEFGQGRLEVLCHALGWSTLKLAVITCLYGGCHYGHERLAQASYSSRARGT